MATGGRSSENGDGSDRRKMYLSNGKRRRFIYDILYPDFNKIVCLLDSTDKWKELGGTYFNFEIGKILEFGREKSPSTIMLTEWGYQNHTITKFFQILAKMKMFQAMSILKDYVDPHHYYLLFEGEATITGTVKNGESTKQFEESMFVPNNAKTKLPKPPNPFVVNKPGRTPVQDTAYGPEFSNLSSLADSEHCYHPDSVDLNKQFNKKLSVDQRNLNKPDSMSSLPSKVSPMQIKQQNNIGKRAGPIESSPPRSSSISAMTILGKDIEGAHEGAKMRYFASPSSQLPRPPLPFTQLYQSLPMHMQGADSIEDNTKVPSMSAAAHPDTEPKNWHTPDHQLHRSSNYSSRKGLSSLNGDSILQPVPFDDIIEATNNFSPDRILGQGGFGVVYEGNWKKIKVAIKRIIKQTNPGLTSLEEAKLHQSYVELHTLNKYRIDNILPLYGYSEFDDGLCLIYQFMANGSLEDRLLRKNNTPPLRWRQRLTIAKGSACGIHYLHNCDKQIIHGDIKTANILLDGNMEPKIGDFGLAREGPKSACTDTLVSAVHGTKPYLPIDYLRDKRLSTKVDTYSFGIVLFELATGMRAYDTEKRKFLRDFVLDCDGSKYESMKDRSAGSEYGEAFMEFINTGLRCVSVRKKDRPEMVQVLEWLDNKLQFLDAKECAELQRAERRRDNTDGGGHDEELTDTFTDSVVGDSQASASTLETQFDQHKEESSQSPSQMPSGDFGEQHLTWQPQPSASGPYQNIPNLTLLGTKEPSSPSHSE